MGRKQGQVLFIAGLDISIVLHVKQKVLHQPQTCPHLNVTAREAREAHARPGRESVPFVRPAGKRQISGYQRALSAFFVIPVLHKAPANLKVTYNQARPAGPVH